MAKIRKVKSVASSHTELRSQFELLPLPALGGLVFGFLLGFIAAEVAFYVRPHPLHWAVAAGGGALGYLIGVFYANRNPF